MLSIAIQHHPSRLLPEALRRYEVVDDPDPDGLRSAIRTYQECLRRTPDWCTRRLVLQDDVQLCVDFDARAEEALVQRPGDLVALFVPGTGLHGRWMREAWKAGKTWTPLPTSANWQPVVALAWPRGLVEPFLAHAEEHIARRRARKMHTMCDDPVVGSFCRAEKLTVWATVPCLVEHPDLTPSLVKQRAYGGKNPARKAAVFFAD